MTNTPQRCSLVVRSSSRYTASSAHTKDRVNSYRLLRGQCPAAAERVISPAVKISQLTTIPTVPPQPAHLICRARKRPYGIRVIQSIT